MPTRTIDLTQHLDLFVERQVASGRYSDAGDVVRDALRLLEELEQERQAKQKALRQAAKLGFDEIDQGKGILLRGRKAVDQFVTEIAKEVTSRPFKNRK